MDVYTGSAQAEGMQAKNSIQTLFWRDIRDQVRVTNPELVQIIDDIDPPDTFRLYKINYRYGDDIVHQGMMRLPNQEGKLVPIDDPSILPSIQEDLSYNYGANPLCLILNNTVEFFLDLGYRTAPMMVVGKGGSIGMWAALSHKIEHQPPFLWSISAGARSVFMLPKISDKISHNRMSKALGISVEKPKNFMDQWKVFNAISGQEAAVSPWHCELLAFSKEWLEHFRRTCLAEITLLFLTSQPGMEPCIFAISIFGTQCSHIL